MTGNNRSEWKIMEVDRSPDAAESDLALEQRCIMMLYMMQDRHSCSDPRAIRMLVSVTLTAMAFFSSQSYSPILLIHGDLDDAILRSGMTVQIMPSVRELRA